jgi:hypothetical protein
MSDHERFVVNFALGLVVALTSLEICGHVLHWSDWVAIPAAFAFTLALMFVVNVTVLRRLRDRPPKSHDAKGQPLLLKLGHMGIWAAIAFGAVTAVIDLALIVLDHSYPPVVGWVISPLFLCFYYLLARHDARLCESCVGSLPLNAQEQSQSWRKVFLKYWHCGRLVPLVVFGGMITSLIFLNGVKSAVSIAGLPMDVAIVAMWTAELHHRRLLPWCPWCRGDGGYDETVPEPVPPSVKV